MEFAKYGSILNWTNKQAQHAPALSRGRYAVYEKIHGANFSIWIGEDEVRYAKRTGFIQEGEQFNNYQTVMNALNIQPQAQPLVIYGELFGGNYPHPDVPANKDVSQVQGGVYYGPEQMFIAFDVKTGGQFFNVESAANICEQLGIWFVEPLMTGSMLECAAHNVNNLQTTIPEILSLPSIDDNVAEGIIIRPFEEPVNILDYRVMGSRGMFKIKSDAFLERTSISKKARPVVPLDPEVAQVLEVLETFFTLNRLNNVLSKHPGLDSMGDAGRYIGLMVRDVLDEYNVEVAGMEGWSKKQVKQVTGRLPAMARAVIVEYLK